MKVTVIGFWGAYPGWESASSCYLVEKDGYALLLDCGSGALSRMPGFIDPKKLDAVVLSHYHPDHVADIGALQHVWQVQNSLKGTEDVLPIYAHEENEAGFKNLTHKFTKGIAYKPDEILSVGPFVISFMKTKHPVPCYGMRISDGESDIVYTADSSYLDEWAEFSKGADLLITDCNFYQDQDGEAAGHMNSLQVGGIAEQAGVKTLFLSHLPHFGEHRQLLEQASSVFGGKVNLAYEGLTWEG
ncbi:MBL fold metallo-hydrolase [Terribacillus sp. DMT04]|uniref:MBL fold metallo-hydrolase n=1 Tax=Terribacillus sp. DMT04 TaxID=2850441 RepID=UPI001C2C246C|nr:MBL fold metallo-hydrolase [Terribacillus sp. DMT04]QXE02685.1 MBL fold metallo-hydrolase [Terribacillus sp. DMT04]